MYNLELWYGVLLLVLFVALIFANSLLESRRTTQLIKSAATGPGGRPLPATRRRLQNPVTFSFTPTGTIGNTTKRVCLFSYMLLIASFVANIANVITHALYDTNNPETQFGWWCGEETSVCS